MRLALNIRAVAAAATVLTFTMASFAASRSAKELATYYEYNRSAPIDVKQNGVQKRDGVKVYDITYAAVSPLRSGPGAPKINANAGRVPAYVVVPPGKGPFPAVVWGHWMMQDSPFRNRKEFLDEAVTLAKSGVLSIMIDAVMVRPGFKEVPDPIDPQNAAAFQQDVLDMRRAIDLLEQRRDVDMKRIAYVGHSFHASVGGVLTGVEPRLSAFVLMAGNLRDDDYVTADSPQIVEARKQIGMDRLKKHIEEWRFTDAYPFISQPRKAPVLLQYATEEDFLHAARAREYVKFVADPKELKIYKTNHALNAEAREDRVQWLAKQLKFTPPGKAELAKVQDIK